MTEVTLAVAADGLSRRFGLVQAVRGVSLSLSPGSVLLLVGPNGSGKTTLLRLLATALRPTAGWAQIFGRDAVREAGAVREITAFVGSSPGLYGALSAIENLEFAAAMSGVRRPGVASLEAVGLNHVAHRPVRTFSQGMKRRLALARAWMRAPRLLLMDEPFNGLDADGLRVLEQFVNDVKNRRGSIVLATHEWERGLTLADSVIALVDGRTVAMAPSEQFSAARLDGLTRTPLAGTTR